MRESLTFNEDCMIGMARYPDNYFDLAVVDPPYGIGESNKFKSRYIANKKWANPVCNHTHKDWDYYKPDKAYFTELLRVSKNQIIWGANYFTQYIPPSMGWIFWDKRMSGDFSDGELAYTSYDRALKKFDWLWSGFKQKVIEKRIHPTQKPVALYDWIYINYLPNGGKVIDTHLGSGSNRIAADKQRNIDFYGWEIDKDYFEAQEKRWRNYKAQTTIFDELKTMTDD